MDNSLYVGLSRQIVLQQQMDIIANNVANADTTGFKVEALQTAEDPQSPAFTLGGPEPVKFVAANGVLRDFGQGSLHRPTVLRTRDGNRLRGHQGMAEQQQAIAFVDECRIVGPPDAPAQAASRIPDARDRWPDRGRGNQQ